jgi:hypothetical protein
VEEAKYYFAENFCVFRITRYFPGQFGNVIAVGRDSMPSVMVSYVKVLTEFLSEV